MSEAKDKKDNDTDNTEVKQEATQEPKKKTLGLGTLSLKAGAKTSTGPRSGGVAVEVVSRRRAPAAKKPDEAPAQTTQAPIDGKLRQLTPEEREARIRALNEAEAFAEEQKEKREKQAEERDAMKAAEQEDQKQKDAEDREANARRKELEELRQIEEEEKLRATVSKQQAEGQKPTTGGPRVKDVTRLDQEEEETFRERMKRQAQRRPSRNTNNKRRGGKLTVTQVLNEDYEKDRGPSLAAQKRAREKARMAADMSGDDNQVIVREVIVPETITVQELAKRMGEQGSEVVKCLMNLGVMVTITQSIDADTAELVIDDFGHKIRRVTDADIETDLEGVADDEADMKPRPPVVTVMGHVDHGKTSLLDALREEDVVSGEAGGITQHIGAYQVTRPNGQKITFLDTPGHAAFTEMRARGANVTDIVILVVAANDSIMPQTIEAINHAKAAEVPMIVAVNKVDLPDANPDKVKQDLLQHSVVVESMGGDVQCIEVSAKKKLNLDALEEAILLQSEILELKANPDRAAVGTVVEAKMEQGRGSVATILVQRGTLKIGDIFCVGAQWGRVRAIVDDRGKNIKHAIPGQPVEVLGLQGTPESGDQLTVVGDESKARGVSEYRQRKARQMLNVKSAGEGTFEEMLAHAKQESLKHLELVIKGDVHGSVEAIIGTLDKIKLENEDVNIRILHSGVGGITESDVILANAAGGMIIGFNVRANAQARELAEREGVDMRYFNIIYNVIDDVKAVLSGMLAPTVREVYLGQAEVLQVFRITKVGTVAGCMVKGGVVKRGANVRLLRDDVVIHEGTLKTLKRHQDEVKEVKEGMECGMAFEKYEDLKEKDVIECYEVVEEARSVE
jgi:translation initiation factor IF-2